MSSPSPTPVLQPLQYRAFASSPGARALRLAGCAISALAVALVLAGCRDIDDEATLTGALTWHTCDATLTPWSPGFMALNRLGDSAVLRFQSTGGALDQDDYLYVQFPDASALVPGAQLVVELPSVDLATPTPVGALAFNERCPDHRGLSATLTGTLTFDRVGLDRGDEVSGSFEFRVVDGRDATIVYGSALQGTFRLEVRDTPPFTLFF